MGLKTYSIASLPDAAVDTNKLHKELTESSSVNNFTGLTTHGDDLIIYGDDFADESACDSLIAAHSITPSFIEVKYEIQRDIYLDAERKDFRDINYKTEINKAYTPVHTFKQTGPDVGFLDKTIYYRDYVDANNLGTPVLEVTEVYTVDDYDATLNNSEYPVISRIKTWKHYDVDGNLDEVNTKVRNKIYTTRQKKHTADTRRRENIVEQLVDNVGLAGILSGTFSDFDDAFDKLVTLQIDHDPALNGWKGSGKGTIYTDIAADSIHTWLTDTVADNANTQAMVPWMIGLTFKSYIVDKLKGEIQ